MTTAAHSKVPRFMAPQDWQLVGGRPEFFIDADPSDNELVVRILRKSDSSQVMQFASQRTSQPNVRTAVAPAPIPDGDYIACLVESAYPGALLLGLCVRNELGYWPERFRDLQDIERRSHANPWEVVKAQASYWRGPSFSLTTTVYNVDPQFLEELCDSVVQQRYPRFEWLILDNGSTRTETIDKVHEIAARDHRFRYFHVADNLHIVGGNRHLLERAANDYIVPVDADDLLYPQSLETLARYALKHRDSAGVFNPKSGLPKLMYSDEHKVSPTGTPLELIWRSEWSRLQGQSTCVAAHLMAFSREMALRNDVYSDEQACGCHDWDTYLRFADAGTTPLHVPHVLYGWRVHAASAALHYDTKGYLAGSQRAAVESSLQRRELADRFTVENAHPCFLGYFHLTRSPVEPAPPIDVDFIFRGESGAAGDEELDNLRHNLDHLNYPAVRARVLGTARALTPTRQSQIEQAARAAQCPVPVFHTCESDAELGMVVSSLRECAVAKAIVDCSLRLTNEAWLWDAIGTFELDPETGIVGGEVVNDELDPEKRKVYHLGYVAGLDGFVNTTHCFDNPRLGDAWQVFLASLRIRRHVTAAYSGLMVIHRDVFAKCGPLKGIDSHDGIFGVEYCLRASRMGVLTAYSPEVRASRTRPLNAEVGIGTELRQDVMAEYAAELEQDRYYSPELSLDSRNYGELQRIDPPAIPIWEKVARRAVRGARTAATLLKRDDRAA